MVEQGLGYERIIPAYAGSTHRGASICTSASGSSPHTRGAPGGGGEDDLVEIGSSPHTRGAHRRPHRPRHRGRIIPAYAGSTSSYPTCELPRTDHPRIRGEHEGRLGWGVPCFGSSPHTRGAQATTPHAVRKDRIIPAYAGSTGRECRCLSARSDHPRIRGEHRNGCRRWS